MPNRRSRPNRRQPANHRAAALIALQPDRIDWIDTVKGIVLVVIGHSTHSTIQGLIYLYHMPRFFVAAGMLFRPAPPPPMC